MELLISAAALMAALLINWLVDAWSKAKRFANGYNYAMSILSTCEPDSVEQIESLIQYASIHDGRDPFLHGIKEALVDWRIKA